MKLKLFVLIIICIAIISISSVNASEINNDTIDTENIEIPSDNILSDDNYDNEDNYSPTGYTVTFFNNSSTVNLTLDEINWNVKNLTEYDSSFDMTFYIYLSTFKINNIEYTIEKEFPTGGVYGDPILKTFNPNEYNTYDGIFYKTDNGVITDIIGNEEYTKLDGTYYQIVGTGSNYYDDAITNFVIINNECYKYMENTDSFTSLFYKATEGTDYKIVNNKYYTLDNRKITHLQEDEMSNTTVELINDTYFVTEHYDGGNYTYAEAIVNGTYLTSDDGFYYSSHTCRYAISPYNYIRLNNTFYRTVNGKITYTEDAVEKNEYALINGKLYLINNTCLGKAIDLTINSNYTIVAENLVKYYKGSERFVITLLDENNNTIADKNVKITINQKTYTPKTNSNGKASIAINLSPGVYETITECDNIQTQSTVTVKSTVKTKDITKIYKNNTQYQATFIDSQNNPLKNTKVKFNINGVYYTRTTDNQGNAKVNINLNPKTYIITAENPITGELQSSEITVLPSIIENHDLTKYYKNDSQYTLGLLDGQGNPVGKGVCVVFNINGIFYERTSDENGYVKMNINLNPGTYIITANYNGLLVSNNITVKSVLDAENLTMSYHDGSKFTARLLDGQGRPYANQTVTFNINGVFYDRITDSNGQAGLTINLLPDTYIITSSFNGLNIACNILVNPGKPQPKEDTPLANGIIVEIDEYDKEISQINGTYKTDVYVSKNSTTVCDISLNNIKTYPDNVGVLGLVKKVYYDTRIYSNMTGTWSWSDWASGYPSNDYSIHRYEYPATDFLISKIAVRTTPGLSEDGYSFYADCEIAPNIDSMGVTKQYAIENGMHYIPQQAQGEGTGRYVTYDSEYGVIY